MEWSIKKFEELTNKELHDLFQLRINVFVVEQNCPYPEIDGKDIESLHLFKKENDRIIAYARVLPPGLSYPQASIGRVVVDKEFRGKQLGYELVKKAIEVTQESWKNEPIKIQAQAHLHSFYHSFGFESISEEYLEDNIPHIDMIYTK